MKPSYGLMAAVVLAFLLILAVAPASFGQTGADGSVRVALKGHDPVAYFTEKRPVRGTPDISYEWDGARYLFSSARHRNAFVADPDRYAPRYGGYCAGGMSLGRKAEADPQLWKIVDGKLYVFASTKAKETLEADPAGTIERGSRNWKRLK
jgi:YHS domain-containing protein